MFFVIVKIFWPATHTELSYNKSNPDKMNMSQFKHDITRSNLQIAERMKKISIVGENYSEIARQEFNLYYTSSFPILKDYMDNMRSEWD